MSKNLEGGGESSNRKPFEGDSFASIPAKIWLGLLILPYALVPTALFSGLSLMFASSSAYNLLPETNSFQIISRNLSANYFSVQNSTHIVEEFGFFYLS